MKNAKQTSHILIAVAVMMAIVVALPQLALALEKKLVIVTSYPKDLTGPFRPSIRARKWRCCRKRPLPG